ncbi:MAG: ATP-dependent protease [Nitrospirae bacterium CG08_land_8_20_14_0_20_52_24]|nr:MAG: ATP-dependent protease [Nitrospirae bacterium CG08_land_8_20_14_0_20_52_24]PIV84845.1 MAG: ATP-dependent protease [Nitrospirae bacterium CG17_big_fil_post_rev_8_21_14_2_50_50_9]PIW85713.1 MAG: ATP-dependent protease [Nitrospirae bacterium CG_4_8_14_3_um_filter_50_41]PIX86408.1 MAG: ATP-dependent protease [Nitrospirae bacterium CG_4_10_14_3_um_filter_53_41]
MDPEKYRVSPELLRNEDLLSRIDFRTTDEVPALDTTIGQDRAVRAIVFGLRMEQEGYNIYAAGLPGTGKTTLVRNLIQKIAGEQEIPDDWCYVHNFEKPETPRAVRLKAGQGHIFQKEMNQLVEFLRKKIPDVFQSKDYIEEQNQLIEKGNKAKQALFAEIVEKGRDRGFEIKSTRAGFTFTPLKKGKPLTRKDIEKLSPEEQSRIEESQEEITSYLRDLINKFHHLDQETESHLEKFNKNAASFAVKGRFDGLRNRYKDHEKISSFLDEVFEDLLENFKAFLPSQQPSIPLFPDLGNHLNHHAIRYQVNLLVDNRNTAGAPMIEETNPTYSNLVGRIEKRTRFGALQTDFTLIRSGSILRANGGYLIVNMLDLLTHPFSWETLKKTIENKELMIEDIGELYGLISTSGIRPEPIPVKMKVVVIGNPCLYSLLQEYDEDFDKLFKVKADFGMSTRRTDEEVKKYVQFTAKICREENLIPFDRSAMTELLNLISRMVEHKERLSLHFNEVANLIRESSFWAQEAGSETVTARHVEKAGNEKIYRSNLIEDRIQEVIDEGVIMVDVDGEKVGQVNGLAVYAVGNYTFGKPTRITSQTYLGRKGVINIERESELSGKAHSKGVMILFSYLGGRYAQENPLSLSASLAFEQSYDEVDGDSASAAELIAILSRLSGIPVKQNLAVTGSINQHGEIQPIGGVNEKIEGFFKTCRNRGFTGTQGVIIPRQNVRHLCLNKEVIEAVEKKQFHIYQVRHIDEAIGLITGMDAGTRLEDGTYPEDTVNARIQQTLSEMHSKLEENSDDEEQEEEEEDV